MRPMRISLVVAAARNQVIGDRGEIPWRLPDDQKFFRSVTIDHTILMGRKTFDSLGKPLPRRTHLVLSRSARSPIEGVHFFESLASAEQWARERASGDLFVIGGEAVYREALPSADRIFLTRVDAEPEGDTFFPEIDESIWHCVDRDARTADERHAFDFTIETWLRKR
jgi:dihydrofolate reductase